MAREDDEVRGVKKSEILIIKRNQLLQQLVDTDLNILIAEKKQLAAGHNDSEWKKWQTMIMQNKDAKSNQLLVLRAMDDLMETYLKEEGQNAGVKK